MNDSDFQSFCYEEYRRSLSSADDVYRRYPFAVTVIVVLATAAITLGTNKYLPHFLDRVDVTLYYTGLAIALAGTACATLFLMLSIFPKDYEQLEPPQSFHNWREAYRKQLSDLGYPPDVVAAQVADATREGLTLRLVQAISRNETSDFARMRWYNRAMYLIGVAVIALGIAAVLHWTIDFRGLS